LISSVRPLPSPARLTSLNAKVKLIGSEERGRGADCYLCLRSIQREWSTKAGNLNERIIANALNEKQKEEEAPKVSRTTSVDDPSRILASTLVTERGA
jgi:hypothetical protein